MLKPQTLAQVLHQTKRGRIDYFIDNAAFPEGRWGFETFTLTCHRNGERVLRAYVELWDDPVIIRDVFQRVDASFHPLDAAVRLTVNDVFKGFGAYFFSHSSAEMHNLTAAEGKGHKTMVIDSNVRGFGTHALTGDGWLVARMDLTQGTGQQTFLNNPLTSRDHRGATGPDLVASESATFEYFGQETVEVSAGRFACHHFAFAVIQGNHPPYHLWVTRDDFIFVKGNVDAPYNWSFELTEFHSDSH